MHVKKTLLSTKMSLKSVPDKDVSTTGAASSSAGQMPWSLGRLWGWRGEAQVSHVKGNEWVHFVLRKIGKLTAAKPARPCEVPYLGLIFWD